MGKTQLVTALWCHPLPPPRYPQPSLTAEIGLVAKITIQQLILAHN